MNLVPIAVMASGRGSNFEAILSAIRAGTLGAEVRVLISDQAEAQAIKTAQKAGIPVQVISVPSVREISDPGERRKLHDEQVLEALQPFSAQFLVMAGYMRIIGSKLINAFRSPRGYARITNVHPSLLPAFPGIGSYAQAFRFGCQVAGVTVHLTDETVDCGPVCAQEAFSIADLKSETEVEKRGLAIEHQLYPQTLGWILSERFEMEIRQGRRCVRSH